MEPNYFTCTLGQAAALDVQQPHSTINALVDGLARERPDLPAVGFPQPGSKPEDPWTTLIFTFADIKLCSENVASALLHDNEQLLSKRQTIGLLCPSTPDFLFTWLALMRLGHAVLLIAPQCQPAAIVNLCETCEVSLLLYDNVYRELAQYASNASSDALQCRALPFPEEPKRAAFFPAADSESSPPAAVVSEGDVAYLHHTSGTSSGMPKPIPQTHRAGVGVLPCFSSGQESATFTTTPLYHGGIADLFRAWTSQAMIWLFPGKKVPITAANIVKCLDLAKAEVEQDGRVLIPRAKYFSSVPYVLQMMEADPRGLRYLQSMDIVGVGGAALPAEVGDRLVNSKVNLISRFGSAECGFLLSSHRDYAKDKAWQYLRVASGAEKYVHFEPQKSEGESNEQAESLAELVVLPGWPHMAKRNREDASYATSDLFAAHPEVPNAWRYHSRADSQLTLITGKKFDPAPLESSLVASSTGLLDDVLIVGTGRPYPGALLFRSSKAEKLSDSELLEQVWPQVDKMNAESQDHARVGKAMLVPMLVLEKPLEKSSKGTILRGAAEKRFAEQIEAAYVQEDGEEGAEEVEDAQLVETIRGIVVSVKGRPERLTDTTDLFSFGVDSVAGMQIRGKLRRLLPPESKPLPINVVEDCGTIERLAEYIRRRRRGEEDVNGAMEQDEGELKRKLVDQYSNFTQRDKAVRLTNGHSHDADGETIVLTGATGALGAHILDQYRSKAGVRKIYCLVRGVDERAAFERLNKALVQRKLRSLHSSDANDEKVVVLQAALGDSRLGLSDDMYERIASEATIIMHVAWSVNFRMKLRSFVKDNIAGVTHLINLALASPRAEPPRFAFCSSVASAMAYHGADSLVPERVIDDTSAATALGYSQSKWVAEQICWRASESTRLKGRVFVFRVGQLAGDTLNGCWNMKEAWPMMLSAVIVTGSLPGLGQEKLDWLPVDVAAKALIQGAEAPVRDAGVAVYHVLNDNEKPVWTEMLGWLKKRESFEVVAPAEWVKQLESAVNGGSDHPASQLLDHWRRAYVRQDEGSAKSDREAKVRFDMSRTKAALPVLRDVRPVDEAYFEKLWTWISASM
ncbi:putative NRPS-like protein biosynthetic cluster [Friedmanniomyces endolithicus]|nr:hypothetical protein LTR75_013735 [Friedmanniomyces endolithicus]KAK0849933.1 hypothetical protein LTR03_004894 [Friedmanniomyces endolithicus]KAK0868717.1 hypothetical protein LTR87_014014 [Friedmanniomyces endolithicus]KAK0893680.1 hypothetical protein LTR57_023875 [Friedmanniomyces endolithicus]KAK0959855.1 hypothetical protein LTS01_021215 [Friedmanniomyces endolithicus]